MTDLSSCCQQVLLDHYSVCEARRGTQAQLSEPAIRQCTACPHSEVLHAIRSNGSRGACSVSTGVKATPCGCPGFEPEPAVGDALFDLPTPEPQRGPRL